MDEGDDVSALVVEIEYRGMGIQADGMELV
jgi:hypothetical protein